MKFIQTIRAAIYSRDYVSRFKGRSFGQMTWFLFRLCLAQGVLLILVAIPLLYPAVRSLTSGSFVRNHYPAGLEVNIKDGQVSTNMQEPYFVAFPESASSSPKNLLAIDTSDKSPIDALKEYDTLVLLTKDSLASKKPETGEIRIFPLTDVKDFHVSQESAQAFLDKIRPVLYILSVAALLLLPLVIGSFTTLWYVAILLGYALVTWLVAKVRKMPMKYSEAYMLSGYLLTFPIIIDTAMTVFGLGSPAIRAIWTFVFFAIFACMAVLNIRKEEIPGA